MALDFRALIQRLLGNTVVEDRSNEAEVERRLRLAFNSPGVSSTGALNLAFPPVIAGNGIFDVHAYGAIGDGTTDDTAAITAAIAAAGQLATVLFRPGKTYKVTSSLTMIADDQTWWMYGAQISVASAFAGITIGTNTLRVRRGKIYGGIVQAAAGAIDWTAGGCGYRLLKANGCVLKDVNVRWLEKGIEITSPAPPNHSETTQNWIEFQMVADCALAISLFANDSGTVNENTFRGGEISYSDGATSATGRYALTIDRHASALGTVNGTKFFGTYFGCSKLSNRPNAFFLNCNSTMFDACHCEGFPSPMATFSGDALLGYLPNVWWGGGANYLTPEIDLASGTTGIAAPFIYTGQDGAGIAGGLNAGSAYVWLVKVLGAAGKTAIAVKNAADTVVFSVRADGAVFSGSNTSEGTVIINGPAATSRLMLCRTAGVARWFTGGNGTAEGGANAGTDWILQAYSDAGALIGTALTVTRATMAATWANAVKSSSPTAGVGYATGAGGTVTQGTSKATAVTLDKVTGLITTHNAALNAGVIVSFVWNNSALAATDLVAITHESGGTTGAYTVNARATGAGTAAIDIRNNTAGNLSEALVLRFAVVKSVSA